MQEYDRKVLFNFEHNKTTTKIYFGCLELKHIERVVDYIKVYVSKLFVCLFFKYTIPVTPTSSSKLPSSSQCVQ